MFSNTQPPVDSLKDLIEILKKLKEKCDEVTKKTDSGTIKI